MLSVEIFRPYLYEREFTLETEYMPLVWLHNLKNQNSEFTCRKYRLADYNYKTVYKKGHRKFECDFPNEKYLSCKFVESKTREPDSGNEASKTEEVHSDDKQYQLFSDVGYEGNQTSVKSGIYPGVIIFFGRGAIPIHTGASVFTPRSDEDIERGGPVPEISPNEVEPIRSIAENIVNNFKFGDSL